MTSQPAPLDLPGRLARHLEESRLLEGVDALVSACSGGADSTALTLLLSDLHVTGLVVAHVAHGLRGEAGEEDARAAGRLASDLSLGFFLRRVDVPLSRQPGKSLEAEARRLRYAELLAVARELGPATLVATGHTLDDQAETVLLNLARHAGRSRGGIRSRRPDGVVRPLLPFTRRELRAFLTARGVPWREDESNQDVRFLRNRIRLHDLPRLEATAPGAAARLARAAEAWTYRLDALDARIDAALDAGGARSEGPFPRALLAGLGQEAAGRLLLRAAARRGAVPGRAQMRRVLDRLVEDTAFQEAFAGARLVADARTVRLVTRPG